MTFVSNRLVCVFPWESWELLDRLHVLTALLRKHRLPQKGLLRHVIGLGDIHPSHGAHVPPHVPPGTKGEVWLHEGGRQKQWVRRHQSEREKETSASHRDGKIPPILEIRTESPRQSMLAPPRLTIRPFGSGLSQASLALIQSNTFEWVHLCSDPTDLQR